MQNKPGSIIIRHPWLLFLTWSGSSCSSTVLSLCCGWCRQSGALLNQLKIPNHLCCLWGAGGSRCGPPAVCRHRPSARSSAVKLNIQQQRTQQNHQWVSDRQNHVFYLSFLQIFLASATTHWQFPASERKHELRCVPPHLRSLSPCKLHKISRAGKTKSFSGTCQLWFVNKTVSYLHYSTWKEKVLRCQYLFVLEEITRFMQCMPLKESHAWLKCLLSEMENGFGEAYSSKSALKGCHVVWRAQRQSKRCLRLSELQQSDVQFSLLLYSRPSMIEKSIQHLYITQ